MPESQENALPAGRHFKPRAFRAEWALDAACSLDAVSPGFLAHVIYASDLKRQTIFMSLGEVHARQAVAVVCGIL